MRLECNSIDKKVILKLDTGRYVNALNRKMCRILFPDVELQFLNVILKKILDYPPPHENTRAKYFLYQKGKKFRIDTEVMSQHHTSKVLSRKTTFLVGILRSFFILKKNNCALGSTESTQKVRTAFKVIQKNKPVKVNIMEANRLQNL